jgi:hypothetical protein
VDDSAARSSAIGTETNMTTGPSASMGSAPVVADKTMATAPPPPQHATELARTEVVDAQRDADDRPPRRRSRMPLVAALLALPAMAAAAYVVVSQQGSSPAHSKHATQSNEVSVLPPDAAPVSVLPADANASVVHVDAATRADPPMAAVDAGTVHADAAAPARADAAASVVATVDAGHVIDAAVIAVADASRPVDAGLPAGETKAELAKQNAAKARDAMARQDWSGALAAAEAALHVEPDNYNLQELAARAACRAGKPEVARSHAAGLIPRDRRNVLRQCVTGRPRPEDGDDER